MRLIRIIYFPAWPNHTGCGLLCFELIACDVRPHNEQRRSTNFIKSYATQTVWLQEKSFLIYLTTIGPSSSAKWGNNLCSVGLLESQSMQSANDLLLLCCSMRGCGLFLNYTAGCRLLWVMNESLNENKYYTEVGRTDELEEMEKI